MALHPDGVVEFEAGGEKYTAVFGFRAMKAVEAKYDRPFFQAVMTAMPSLTLEDFEDKAKLREAGASLRFTELGYLFKAGLLKHHPDLTDDDVENIIDELGLTEVGGIIGETFAAAMARGGDDKSPENPPRRPNRQARRARKTG